MDGPVHLLSLKVMRISRPELASAWQPFYSSSPSFSAHSTASILSLQGTAPLPGHPKTLRDLTHASELLTLPSSFGSIQLGETFSSCLCINNEAQVDIEAVSMKVEMQTVTAKVVLAEFGGQEHRLAAGDTFESAINHEIKELGQHVLACSVTYRLPPHARQLPDTAEDADGMNLQTFRKFYKFAVTNPLSVKTKVHTPRSPSALMSLNERDKVFLEVHIQNLTQEPMHFERMQFECVDGWSVRDVNIRDVDDDGGCGSLFSGSLALMQPQDIRQYIYILTPKSVPLAPVVCTPGSVIPLGRLDIFWRSPFGEPGRLLTSMLSRRIPLPPPPVQQPASALPSYLKRTIIGSPPSRPQSPQSVQPRPDTPPSAVHRPDSPSRIQSPPIVPPRPQSPFQLPAPTFIPDIEVNLSVRDTHRMVQVEKVVSFNFALTLSAPPPGKETQHRVIKLAVQHIQPPRDRGGRSLDTTAIPEAFSPRLPSSGFSTPSSITPAFNYSLAHQKLLTATSRQNNSDELNKGRRDRIVMLPPPIFNGPGELKPPGLAGVVFIGSSVTSLPPFELFSSGTENPGHATEAIKAHVMQDKAHVMQEFELSYLPTQKGYTTIGGLRVLLIEDKLIEESNDDNNGDGEKDTTPTQARVLKEWDVVAEVWVSS